MKKKLMIIVSFLMFSLFATEVNASSVSISSSKSSIVVGNTVTITTTISSSSVILQAYGTIKCNSGLSLTGGTGEAINFYNGNNSNTTALTYSNTYRATRTGTITCSVSSVSVGTAASDNFENLATKSVSINVINASSGGSSGSSSGSSSNRGGTTADKKKYSSDNNLSSLGVKGYNLSPKFNKDTLEYKIDLDSSVEEIEIEAAASDKKATINGTGKQKVSEGINTFEIKVTAENGNEKVYKIIVNVKDANPIVVKIGKNKYTVVKKNKDLAKKIEGFEESVVSINNQDVVSYVNNKVGYTLVLLKDDKGKIEYYIYNSKDNSYTLYKEYEFGGLRLNIIEMDKSLLPKGYKKSKFKYNNENITAYKVKSNSKFYLFYAMNINTGKKNLYVYDSVEHTVQCYNNEEVEYYKNLNDKYSLFILIGLGVIGLIIIIIATVMILKTRNRKKKYNYSQI